MAEYIDREDAINAISIVHGELIEIGEVVDILDEMPAADVHSVTRCKDCVYRPYYEPSDSKSASDLVFPDYRFNLCPCRVEDFWYSWMPDDDWFCAYGKRKDGET